LEAAAAAAGQREKISCRETIDEARRPLAINRCASSLGREKTPPNFSLDDA